MVELDLTGETVLLLGGGPSLRSSLQEITEKRNYDRKMIAINDSIYPALYSNLLFFRDPSWYISNRKIVEEWNGPVISSIPSQWYSDKVNIVKMKHCDDFLIGGDYIKHGRSAGHIALSLAISLRATLCVLVGYDCRNLEGRSHFCRAEKNIDLVYSSDFLPAWTGWGAAAQRVGVEVVNATLDSAIIEFPYRPLAEFL